MWRSKSIAIVSTECCSSRVIRPRQRLENSQTGQSQTCAPSALACTVRIRVDDCFNDAAVGTLTLSGVARNAAVYFTRLWDVVASISVTDTTLWYASPVPNARTRTNRSDDEFGDSSQQSGRTLLIPRHDDSSCASTRLLLLAVDAHSVCGCYEEESKKAARMLTASCCSCLSTPVISFRSWKSARTLPPCCHDTSASGVERRHFGADNA